MLYKIYIYCYLVTFLTRRNDEYLLYKRRKIVEKRFKKGYNGSEPTWGRDETGEEVNR